MTDERPCPIEYFPKRCHLVRLRAVSQAYHPQVAALHWVFDWAFALRQAFAPGFSCARSLAARSENLIAAAATDPSDSGLLRGCHRISGARYCCCTSPLVGVPVDAASCCRLEDSPAPD